MTGAAHPMWWISWDYCKCCSSSHAATAAFACHLADAAPDSLIGFCRLSNVGFSVYLARDNETITNITVLKNIILTIIHNLLTNAINNLTILIASIMTYSIIVHDDELSNLLWSLLEESLTFLLPDLQVNHNLKIKIGNDISLNMYLISVSKCLCTKVFIYA